MKGAGQVPRGLSIITQAGIGKGRRVRYRQLSTLRASGEHMHLMTIPHNYMSFNGEEGSGSDLPWPAESERPHVIRMSQRTTLSRIQISGNESQSEKNPRCYGFQALRDKVTALKASLASIKTMECCAANGQVC